MDIADTAKSYLDLFFYLGLSPYSPNTDQMSRVHQLLCYIPRYIQLIMSIGLSAYVMVRINCADMMQDYRQIENLLILIYLSVVMMRAVSVLCDCIFYKEQIHGIFAQFQSIRKVMAIELNHRIDYRPLVRQHARKMLIIFSSFTVYVVAYIFRRLIFDLTSPISVPIRILQSYQALTLLHVTLYIDMQTFHMAELNKIVRRDSNQHLNVVGGIRQPLDLKCIVSKLKCYKIIHFKMWEASMMHNRVFGWCSVAVLLHNFAESVYTAFWLFNELRRKTGSLVALRKFQFATFPSLVVCVF